MSHGPNSTFNGAIVSGASTVSFDLGRTWKTVYAEVGTMSTAVALNVFGGASAAGTYRQVFHPQVNSATVIVNPYVISNIVGTNGGIVPVPNGCRYLQFRGGAVVSGGVSMTLICSD